LIEAVADIQFDKVDWAQQRVGEEDLAKDSIKGMPKLHHVHSCEGQSIGIDVPPAVVNNSAQVGIALGNDYGGLYL
jgi:hypothetical protein